MFLQFRIQILAHHLHNLQLYAHHNHSLQLYAHSLQSQFQTGYQRFRLQLEGIYWINLFNVIKIY